MFYLCFLTPAGRPSRVAYPADLREGGVGWVLDAEYLAGVPCWLEPVKVPKGWDVVEA